MKKINVILLLSTLLTSMHANAHPVCVDHYGSMHCEAGTVDSIHYRGFVDVDGTTVSGDFDILGNVNVRSARLNSVSIRGVSYLYDTLIANDVNIIGNVTAKNVGFNQATKIVGHLYGTNLKFEGPLEVIGRYKCQRCDLTNNVNLIGEISSTNSHFARAITINARYSLFDNTKLQDIYVNRSNDREQQQIELRAGTRVKNITFASQEGVVIVRQGATITGKVIGGEVIKKY